MTPDRLIKVRALLTTNSCLQQFSSFLPPIQSANYVRTELPIRISHRLRDLQALPYVVVKREGVAKVYEVRTLPVRYFLLLQHAF